MGQAPPSKSSSADGESSPLLAGREKSSKDSEPTPTSSTGNEDKQQAEAELGDVQLADGLHADRSKSDSERIHQAAYLVRDAVLGEMADEDPSDGSYRVCVADPSSVFGYRPGHQAQWRDQIARLCQCLLMQAPVAALPILVGTVLVALTFTEPPSWCRNHTEGCALLLSMEGLPSVGGAAETLPPDDDEVRLWQYYPNTKSMLISIEQSFLVEATCLAVLAFWTLLRIGRDGSNLGIYLRKGPARANRSLQLICIVLLAVGLFIRVTFWHPYLRAILVVTFLPSVQRDLKVLVHMLPQTFNILSLLLILMCFYAWLGTILFVSSEEGQRHFSSFVESLWTLYICVTTANYPDVMMPAYNANRWNALYFVSFMILSFFYFLNVVLAAIVHEYESTVESRNSTLRQAAADSLAQAFALLHDPHTGRIGRDTLMSLLQVLHDDLRDTSFRESLSSSDQRQLVFALLDQDGSEAITSSEFENLGLVLQLELVHSNAYKTALEDYLPSIFHSTCYQKIQNMIRSRRFDLVVDCVLVLNALVIAIQSFPELSGEQPTESSKTMNARYQNGRIDTAWEMVETIFTGLYVIECGLKMTVFGSRAYFEQAKNVFDFVITVVAVACSVLVYMPNKISDSRVIRMVVMARVLRLLRILTSRKRFQLIGTISAEILPQAKSVLLILFFLLYFFAVAGTQLYGGMITRDPGNPLSSLVLDTDFSNNDYWGNNFNDMVSAVNVLFNLLVINNWTECESGFEAVTQGKWVRWYFISFHLLGVILVNNLVIAFVINNFMQQFVQLKEDQRQEQLLVIDNTVIDVANRQVKFDSSNVTGTRTNLTGHYIARYRRSGSWKHSDRHRGYDRLRQLFTQTQD